MDTEQNDRRRTPLSITLGLRPAVRVLAVVAAIVLLAGCGSSGRPEGRTYNDASVTLGDGAPIDAVACESEAEGVEVRYGPGEDLMSVRHMREGETVVVWDKDGQEITSASAGLTNNGEGGVFEFLVEFPGETTPVVVEYEIYDMGWCNT